ncbi:hypothetical protein EBN03_19070 [Nocardia stercoris]|uniref:Uncharacterized protein n=1 Tax=Nocardia stercoris TaxID=2483361 RepID=A0A3M2L4I7_9NOCA|nr:hypothetical protein EBN03_19070 [Nocardia stercoris]
MRHLAAYVIAAGVLVVFTLLVGVTARAAPLRVVPGPWGVVLAIDFLMLFGYTIAPRREKSS